MQMCDVGNMKMQELLMFLLDTCDDFCFCALKE